jgi:hypothetical protein
MKVRSLANKIFGSTRVTLRAWGVRDKNLPPHWHAVPAARRTGQQHGARRAARGAARGRCGARGHAGKATRHAGKATACPHAHSHAGGGGVGHRAAGSSSSSPRQHPQASSDMVAGPSSCKPLWLARLSVPPECTPLSRGSRLSRSLPSSSSQNATQHVKAFQLDSMDT